MKKEEVISELGRPYLRPIGLSQGVFLVAIIISPFLWIWGSGDIAWKTALTGLIGVILTKILYWIVQESLKTVADEVIKEIEKETPKTSKFQERLTKMAEERKQSSTHTGA